MFFAGTTLAAGAAVATAAVLGGALVSMAAGAAAITAIGVVLELIIHKSDAEYLEEQVEDGHLLLFVRTRDSAHEGQATEILAKHTAFDVKIYEIPAASRKSA